MDSYRAGHGVTQPTGRVTRARGRQGRQKLRTYKVASAKSGQRAKNRAGSPMLSPRWPALRDWPVSQRLIAVIVLALVMGLVFGGLRVVAAVDSSDQFGRVAQLANLGQQVTGLVQALQDERDQTTGLLPITSANKLQHWYKATNAEAVKVRALAAGIGGSYPADIRSVVLNRTLMTFSSNSMNICARTVRGASGPARASTAGRSINGEVSSSAA